MPAQETKMATTPPPEPDDTDTDEAPVKPHPTPDTGGIPKHPPLHR